MAVAHGGEQMLKRCSHIRVEEKRRALEAIVVKKILKVHTTRSGAAHEPISGLGAALRSHTGERSRFRDHPSRDLGRWLHDHGGTQHSATLRHRATRVARTA